MPVLQLMPMLPADRVGAEHPERQLQHEQHQRVVDDFADDHGSVVLAARQSLADAAAFDGPVEPDAFEDLVDGFADEFGDDLSNDQDHHEQQCLGCDGDDRPPHIVERIPHIGTFWENASSRGLGWGLGRCFPALPTQACGG